MAPISSETLTITSQVPKHFGPVVPEISSVWFRLFLYHTAQAGPESILYPKGARVTSLPDILRDCETVTVQTWEHDPTIVPLVHLLPTLNDLLWNSPVLVQANTYYSQATSTTTTSSQSTVPSTTTTTTTTTSAAQAPAQPNKPKMINVPFPMEKTLVEYAATEKDYTEETLHTHPTIKALQRTIPLDCSFGFIRMKCIENPANKTAPVRWVPYELNFGIPLFSIPLNAAVCELIEKCQLFSDKNLAIYSKRSRELALRVLDFIAQCNGEPSVDLELGVIPFPRRIVQWPPPRSSTDASSTNSTTSSTTGRSHRFILLAIVATVLLLWAPPVAHSIVVAPTPEAPPVEAPAEAPVNAPQDAPQSAPQEAPQAAPVEAPQNAPQDTPQAAPQNAPQDAPQASVEAPVDAPVTTPLESPIDSPIQAPAMDAPAATVESPVETPVEAPVDSPIAIGNAPVSAPADAPVNAPVAANVPLAAPVAAPTTSNPDIASIKFVFSGPVPPEKIKPLRVAIAAELSIPAEKLLLISSSDGSYLADSSKRRVNQATESEIVATVVYGDADAINAINAFASSSNINGNLQKLKIAAEAATGVTISSISATAAAPVAAVNESLSGGAIAGIIIGCIVVVAVVGVVIYALKFAQIAGDGSSAGGTRGTSATQSAAVKSHAVSSPSINRGITSPGARKVASPLPAKSAAAATKIASPKKKVEASSSEQEDGSSDGSEDEESSEEETAESDSDSESESDGEESSEEEDDKEEEEAEAEESGDKKSSSAEASDSASSADESSTSADDS